MSEVNALVAHQDAEGSITLKHKVVDDSFLPDGDVQLAGELKPRHLGEITRDVSVLEAPQTLRTIVGGVTGRTRVVVHGGF
jgi:hypothetical protein